MGTPAPNIAGTFTGTIQEGTGAVITGALSDSGNSATPNTWSITATAAYGTVTINPTTGQWSYDLNDTNAVVKALDPGQTLTDVFTVRLSDPAGADSQVITITIQGNFCFAAGTMLRSESGMVAAETLRVGDRVWTLDRGFQPIRWVGRQDHLAYDMQRDPHLRAVQIRKGVLGSGLPVRDLRLSRQHRVLLRAGFLRQLIGADQALIPVHRLIGLPGISIAPIEEKLSYIHLLFDHHEVVVAEGVGAESLLLGEEVLRSQGQEMGGDLAAIPRDLRARCAPVPARIIPDTATQKRIARRLVALAAGQDLGGRFASAIQPKAANGAGAQPARAAQSALAAL